MGIGIHEYKFLKKCSKFDGLGNTITIGRQQLFYDGRAAHAIDTQPSYCEHVLIQEFGSSNVDSIDVSSYEGATIVHDLNMPIESEKLLSSYDTVYDGGALEHIFDINVALTNIHNLLKPGGRVIHVVPSNNQCGHGFYQFSPELFFSIYSPVNGFEKCEIYIAVTGRDRSLYRVAVPVNGLRQSFRSVSPANILVVATKDGINRMSRSGNRLQVSQSDYQYHWEGVEVSNKSKVKTLIKSNRLLFKIIYPIYRFYYWNVLSWISDLNPDLKKVKW